MPKRAAEEEEAFPRRRVSAEQIEKTLKSHAFTAGRDIGSKRSSEEGQQAKRRKVENEDADAEVDPTSLAGAKVTQVPRLRLRHVGEGVLLVGAVRDCTEEEIQLDLPFHQVGYVSRSQATEPDCATGPLPALSDLFQPGNLAIVVVTGVFQSENSGATRIELSMRPVLVNAGLQAENVIEGMWLPAVVQDEEEHVFRLNFGVADLQGVLSKAEAAGLPFDLSPGLIVSVGIQAVTSKGTVKCTIQQEGCLGKEPLSAEMLKAGFLVDAVLTKTFKGEADGAKGSSGSAGLQLKFCGSLTGFVHGHHHHDAATEMPAFQRREHVKARVIAVVPGLPPVAHLTLLPHLVSWTSWGNDLPAAAAIGQRVPIEVLDHATKYGSRVVCSIAGEGSEPLKLPGFVPNARLADKGCDVEAPQPGIQVEARVLSYDFMEGQVICTRRPYDMKDDTLVSVAELVPGQPVSGKVVRITDFGIFVKLSEYIQGLVSLRQLTDVPLAAVPKRFQVGNTVKCRVLSTRPQKRQVSLTAKKTLVNDSFQLSKFEQVKKDMLVTGFVSKVQAYGHIVSFYGSMFGLIPAQEFQDNEAPALGMAVTVRVKYVGRKTKRLLLSLNLDGGKTAEELGTVEDDPRSSFPGQTVKDIRLHSCLETGLVVSASTEMGPLPLRGYVPMGHLADDLAFAKEKFSALAAVDEEIALPDTGVVLADRWAFRPKEGEQAKDESERFVLLSLKPSLHLAATEGAFVTKYADLKETGTYSGYIKQIHDFGAFVSVGSWKIQGLAPKFMLANLRDDISLGQTVRVHVSRIDPELGRFQAELRAEAVPDDDEAQLKREAEALRRFLVEKSAFQAQRKRRAKQPKSWSQLTPGAVLKAQVTEVTPRGAVLSLPAHEGITATLVQENIPKGTQLEVGKSVSCAVLDFDPEHRLLDVSLQAELVAAAGSSSSSKAGRKQQGAAAVSAGLRLEAQAALQKPSYTVLWTKDPPAVLFAPPFGQRSWPATQSVLLHCTEDTGDVQRVIACCPHGVKLERAQGSGVPRILRPGEELKVGSKIKMTVRGGKRLQLALGAPIKVRGHLHAALCVDAEGEVGSGGTNPLEALGKKRTVEARIVNIRGGDPVWHLDLTCRPSLMNDCDPEEYQKANARWSGLNVDQQVPAAVLKVMNGILMMEVAPRLVGRIRACNCSRDPDVMRNLGKHFKRGQVYQTRVVGVDRSRRKLELSLVDGSSAKDAVVMAQLESAPKIVGNGIAGNFLLPGQQRGYAHITELFDVWMPFPQSKLKPGAVYEAKVLREKVEQFGGKAEISLRASRVYGKKESPQEKRPASAAELEAGQKVSGYVVHSGPTGVLVALSSQIIGRIGVQHLADLVDESKVEEIHKPGELIQDITVGDVNLVKNHVSLSLRNDNLNLAAQQFTVGDIVSGVVKAIMKFGIFVRLNNSRVDALVHVSEVSDTPSVSLDSFKVGMPIRRAKVLSIDGWRINLGIKASHFEGADIADVLADESSDEEANDIDAKADEVADPTAEGGDNTTLVKGKKRKGDVPGEEAAEAPPWDLAAADLIAGVGAKDGFEWADFKVAGDSASDVEEAGGEGEEAVDEGQKLSKRQRKALKQEEAEEIREREEEQAAGEWAKNPTSVEDFERLLLSHGNTSIIWIRYMAFHLKLSDLEKARQVAERAVKHVGFSDAKERFNTWVAYMNLECTFGTEETADAVFRRASSHNPAKHVHLQLARIHERNKKIPLATKSFQAACRKFGHSKKVWLAFLTFLYRQGDLEGGRKTLPNSLAVLPKRKHALVVSRAALLEYSFGSAERGRSVFEGLLDSYPKRTDLWSVYIDAHIGAHTPPKAASVDHKAVRSLMEKCCSMRLKAVKMRFFFKRWLDFEKRWGDAESQELVRTRAREFVESQAA